jgi:uncharacterized protein (DUF302 family)
MTSVSDAERGIVRMRSSHSVAETVDRLESLLKERGVLVFARIDFSADAARVGLTMRPEQLLVFGNPRAGTPLMVASPTAGLDLIWCLILAAAAARSDGSCVTGRP